MTRRDGGKVWKLEWVGVEGPEMGEGPRKEWVQSHVTRVG
jgi:hypothetical protein